RRSGDDGILGRSRHAGALARQSRADDQGQEAEARVDRRVLWDGREVRRPACRRRGATEGRERHEDRHRRLHARRQIIAASRVGAPAQVCLDRARLIRLRARGPAMRRAKIIAAALATLGAASASAAQYEFLAAPQINLSLVYRLDKLTGDII